MQGGEVASDNHGDIFQGGIITISGSTDWIWSAYRFRWSIFVWGYLLLIIDYSCIHLILFRVAFIVCEGLVFFGDIMGCRRV
jgi:hypothetical protein